MLPFFCSRINLIIKFCRGRCHLENTLSVCEKERERERDENIMKDFLWKLNEETKTTRDCIIAGVIKSSTRATYIDTTSSPPNPENYVPGQSSLGEHFFAHKPSTRLSMHSDTIFTLTRTATRVCVIASGHIYKQSSKHYAS
jgi:hypothetical protein